jgi:CHAT domain-containing protein
MSWDPTLLVRRVVVVAFAALLCNSASAQNSSDPEQLLVEAERLTWLKAWTKAEPLYSEAERLFAAQGDKRNALYAQINALRGQLPRLPVPEVSQSLAEYLEDPIVQGDERLRLRCLVIKGETDIDLDPSLAEQSWRDAVDLAEKLHEPAWANRARGELGLVSFLQGDIGGSVIKLGQALKVAETNGDVASVVRWLTLFGHGYVELGRPELALDFYDRAFKTASTVPELQFPVMAYLGKADALAKLGRFPESAQLLDAALAVATREGALGYQSELTLRQALIAYQRKETDRALEFLARAVDLARKAGGNRILAEIALDLARIQREANRPLDADLTLTEGVAVARNMGEHILLPRLLARLADLRASQERYTDAAELLDEANDLLEGLLTKASSPWVRSRVVGGMDEVFVSRIRLEASRGEDPSRAFSALERARARSLLELLLSTPVADVKKPQELRAGERRIAALQLKLLRAKGPTERQRLLDEIFVAEEQLAPTSIELFNRTRTGPRKALTLKDVQRALGPDETLLEFALAEPDSYSIVVTRSTARLRRLPGRAAIEGRVEPLLKVIREGRNPIAEARSVGEILLDRVPELATRRRLIVSPDGDLHQLPFELLINATGKRLLETHIVSYVPSGSVLAILRDRRAQKAPARAALAVSASSTEANVTQVASVATAVPGGAERGVYDLDAAKLPPLPSANDEARAVGSTLGLAASTVLIGDSATELEVKKQPLLDYRVLHFAAHGIVSTKFPARSALILKPAGSEDGLLQAREILTLRLSAELVTLSACDTGTGTVHGQDGVSSLVRPFLAAGARTVVANLWAADDQFSLTLMREFYRRLAAGADIGEALRSSKLKMLEQFGPQAVPKLWSGLLAYGDSANVVKRAGKTAN